VFTDKLSGSSTTGWPGLAPLLDYAWGTSGINRQGEEVTAQTSAGSLTPVEVGHFVGECCKVVHVKRYVVALSMFALLAVSCSTRAPTVSDPAASSSTHHPPARKPVAHIGDTLNLMRVGDQKIAVTLERVIAPATVPAGWGDVGKTYIATQVKIANTGTSTIVGNSNSDVSVVGSDDQSYRADFATVTECKDFAYGWFLLAAGSSTTGCVVFKLPRGITPVKVKYMPSSGVSHDVGEWLNP
jgi:Domain of unknown function (DUF4352)